MGFQFGPTSNEVETLPPPIPTGSMETSTFFVRFGFDAVFDGVRVWNVPGCFDCDGARVFGVCCSGWNCVGVSGVFGVFGCWQPPTESAPISTPASKTLEMVVFIFLF